MPDKTSFPGGTQHSLIQKCRNNDKAAQFEIYRLYYRNMYNTSLRIVNNKAEAEDIMQESFLSAFQKIDTYKGEVSFGAWLKRIVINKSIDSLRVQKRIFEELNENEELTDDSDRDDFKNEETTATAERIKATIPLLPEGYRVVLSLYLLEGYDHEEIAQILGITESSSRSQLVRAKKKLLELLKR